MKKTTPATWHQIIPTSQDVAIGCALAAGFIALAIYVSRGKVQSIETLCWILGAAWLGRTLEKIALRWKVSRIGLPEEGCGKADEARR